MEEFYLLKAFQSELGNNQFIIVGPATMDMQTPGSVLIPMPGSTADFIQPEGSYDLWCCQFRTLQIDDASGASVCGWSTGTSINMRKRKRCSAPEDGFGLGVNS